MFALIRMGLLAGFRSRLPLLLFGMALLVLSLALMAAGFSGRQGLTVGLDVGMSGLRLMALLLSLLLCQELLLKDVERKTLYFLLAYPYSRQQFLLARFATIALLSTLIVLVLALALYLLVLWGGFKQLYSPAVDSRYWLVMAGVLLDLLVVQAFAVLLCTFSTTPFLPLVLGGAFALAARGLGPVIDYLRSEYMEGSEQARLLGPLLEHSFVWLPDLSRLDWRPYMLYALPVDWQGVGLASLMAGAYVVVLLGLAVIIFDKRNFT